MCSSDSSESGQSRENAGVRRVEPLRKPRSEDSFLPLSALQHLAFCERQCALIHLEREWAENRLTAEGGLLHTRVHEQDSESRCDKVVVRGLRLRSRLLGVAGQADVVEFVQSDRGTGLAGRSGRWLPRPVEYKRGKPKRDHRDLVQLCAQAMCLEEMLEVEVREGSLFYGKTRRRLEIDIDAELRAETIALADRLHALFTRRVTPTPPNDSRCKGCSLVKLCLPGAGRAKGYLVRQVRAHLSTGEVESATP